MSGNEPVSVHILDREYTVGVEAGERSSLMAAAKLLDSKMREVRGGNKMAAARALGLDRRTLYRRLDRYGLGSITRRTRL